MEKRMNLHKPPVDPLQPIYIACPYQKHETSLSSYTQCWQFTVRSSKKASQYIKPALVMNSIHCVSRRIVQEVMDLVRPMYNCLTAQLVQQLEKTLKYFSPYIYFPRNEWSKSMKENWTTFYSISTIIWNGLRPLWSWEMGVQKDNELCSARRHQEYRYTT